MKYTEALELLGLSDWEVNPDRVQEAFRFEVRRNHPDTAPLNGSTGTLWSVDQLKAARDLLLNRCNGGEFACKQCGGKGTVRAKMGTRPCGACKGTGERQ